MTRWIEVIGQDLRYAVRGLLKAKAELALCVTGYNLKRLIAIKGVPALLKKLQPCPA